MKKRDVKIMPLDGISIRCIVSELTALGRAAVQKIYQPGKNEIVLFIYGGGKNAKLLISVNPSGARMHLTEEKLENPDSPPMFCRLLRKHLTGAALTDVCQAGLERAVDLVFSARSELEERVERHLIVELCGKNSNVILADGDYKIIDSLRHTDISMANVRTILPGFRYEALTDDKKKDILALSDEEIAGITEYKAKLVGFSPLAEREAEAVGLCAMAKKIKENDFSPCVLYDGDKPVDFWAFVPTQYGVMLDIKRFETLSEAADAYFGARAAKERMQQKSMALRKLVTNLITRCEKKLEIQKKELAEAENRDEYKMLGELITANLYKLSKGQKVAEVENYYEEGCPVVRVPMDERLSPSENAQRYFKKYNKAKTAQIKLTEQIKRNIAEMEYLESVLHETERAQDSGELSQIRGELTDEGYLKPTGAKRQKETPSGPIEKSFSGYQIFVGKNNKQNDYLTLKASRANDIWLHVKDMPGSHVIIKAQNAPVPDEVIEYAAHLAAHYSKANGAPKTAVDYTEVKNVKKPAGAKPGMVVYDPYKTCITKDGFTI